MAHKWHWKSAGGLPQVEIEKPEDVASLGELDGKAYVALSMPVKGVRLDAKMLAAVDADGDGRIRGDEVLAAVAFLRGQGVDFAEVLEPCAADREELASVERELAAAAAAELSAADREALEQWRRAGEDPAVAPLGEATAAALAAFEAVEATVENFFAVDGERPLVTDEPDVVLPLFERINPRHAAALRRFASDCVQPLLGAGVVSLDREGWDRVKGALAPYRAHLSARPVANAQLRAGLEAHEKLLRLKLSLGELLHNFVNMRELYRPGGTAAFQVGVLRLGGREMTLCLEVENEAAHSALSGRSECCILYLSLERPGDKAVRHVCAVVTAGPVADFYPGRRGVFRDRDGREWEAKITKIVAAEVSLAEAFWSPWRKLGAIVAAAVRKFIGSRGDGTGKQLDKAAAGDAGAGTAAMASGVAAIGIGLGMAGAALASLYAVLRDLSPLKLVAGAVALVLVVSLPSVALAWLKLRRRDLGAVLNASGWAVNRPLRLSAHLARRFTRLPGDPLRMQRYLLYLYVVVLCALAVWSYCNLTSVQV